MPAPTVTPHRVGKNAIVTVNGTALRHQSGSVSDGGGVDTVTYPDGFDRHAETNKSASGDLTVIVEFAEATTFRKGDYINLKIEDGTNIQYDGVAFITEVSDSFANDGGWTYSFNWSSHGVFGSGSTGA
jgi:hypothetical protein